MQLSIDSTQKDSTILKLSSENGEIVSEEKIPDKINESLLPKIDRFIQEQKSISWQDIKNIKVHEGPGTRFTRTRLSVAYANALSFALGIKVNNKNWTSPIYNSKPNITKPKHD